MLKISFAKCTKIVIAILAHASLTTSNTFQLQQQAIGINQQCAFIFIRFYLYMWNKWLSHFYWSDVRLCVGCEFISNRCFFSFSFLSHLTRQALHDRRKIINNPYQATGCLLFCVWADTIYWSITINFRQICSDLCLPIWWSSC